MSKIHIMVIFLIRINELKDQLATIRTNIEDQDLVSITLKGIDPPQEPFVKGICAQENVPNFQNIWVDHVQEEIRV